MTQKNALIVWKHKQVKFKNRNRIEILDDHLRLATTNTGIDKGTIVSDKPQP